MSSPHDAPVVASTFRPEIQGLRAIAVGIVALFHVWPKMLPGGYVGVDVFFVISGFLITGLLLREGERTGSIDLVSFYVRRARRLLPAATIVLLLVGLLTPLFLPASQWQDTASEVLSSVFYVENWRLAAQAVDYLGGANAPSPVQHYWSLSVEEQFYIVWPALIIAGLAATRLLHASPRTMLRVVLGIIALASLGASIWLTRTDPASAYFVTHTRVWELSLGGLVALGVPAFNDRTRRLFGLAGVVAILIAAVVFTAKTPFPGDAALLPTIGAALVIISGDALSPLSVFAVLKTRPFQFIGDISYSIYLWHWPLIIFFHDEVGKAIGPVAGAVVLAASIGLAAFSKFQIEDRFRHPRPSQPIWRKVALFASFVVAPLLACGLVVGLVAQQSSAMAGTPADYPGALAITAGAPVPAIKSLMPSLALVKDDVPAAYHNGCHLNFDASEPVPCHYGDPDGKFKVFLIGDSHAANWIPALKEIAQSRGWNATSFTKSSCPMMPIMLALDNKPYDSCLAWDKRLVQIIAEQKPDVVIFGQRYSTQAYPPDGSSSVEAALIQQWHDIRALGPRVIAIAELPHWRNDPNVCLAKDRGCSVPFKSITHPDPFVRANKADPQTALLNFNDVVCPRAKCPAVIGNVIVWRDEHHLTASFSRSMAEVFGKRLDAALAQPPAQASSSAATPAAASATSAD